MKNPFAHPRPYVAPEDRSPQLQRYWSMTPEQRKALNKKKYAWHRAKWDSDPEFREKLNAYWRNRDKVRRSDPAYRATDNARRLERYYDTQYE